MADLGGRTVVVLEARLPSELAGLITRNGGRALSAPALREVPLPVGQEVTDFIDVVSRGDAEMVVFQTGVGARAVLGAAEEMGKKEAFLQALRSTKVVCRGPKPVAVMRANEVPITLVASTPFTSTELMQGIQAQGWDLEGKTVALQHYGETNAYLQTELRKTGARLVEVSVYRWALPEDTAPLEEAIRTMVARRADAVAFTSKSQVRHLFQIAERMGLKNSLREALRGPVVVASVGPVCTRALAEEGITPHVAPEHPKMGPLVLALASYFEGQHAPVSSPSLGSR